MELNVLIRSIYESNEESMKEELIADVLVQINERVVLAQLRRLFAMLATSLSSAKSESLILTIHKTINSLTQTLLESEIETNFMTLLPALITNIGNPITSVRRSTKATIDQFLKKTRNLEVIIRALLEHAFPSENVALRTKALGASLHFLDSCQTIFASRSGLNDARQLIEAIILKLLDPVEAIRKKAQQVLYKIVKFRNYEGFDKIHRRLSHEHQSMLHDIVNQLHLFNEDLKVKEFYKNFKEIDGDLFEDFGGDFIVEDTQGVRTFSLYSELPSLSKSELLSFFPIGFSGLYFNLIREDTLLDCFNSADARVQVQGCKEVLEAFETDVEESIDGLKAYMNAFFKFICYLLSSSNLVIAGHMMRILQTLIQHVSGVQMKAQLLLSVPPLIGKLGEERVSLREQAFFILKMIITSMKKHTLLKTFALFLEDQFENSHTNNSPKANWHIKEELLNLVSHLFLKLFDSKDDWYEEAFKIEIDGDNPEYVRPIDLKAVILTVARFLDDKVMKVRKASLEALAVITSQGTHSDLILSILHENLDSKVYDNLVDKLERGKIYFVNEQGNLEMPLIEIGKFKKQRDKYEERLDQYRRLMTATGKNDETESEQSLTEILEETQHDNQKDDSGIEFRRQQESQKEIDKRLRAIQITYYNKADHPMLTQQERVQRTNDKIDMYLHNHEHDGLDSIKYDIVVPIKDFVLNTSQQPVDDPFKGDKFGRAIFEHPEEQKREQKRELELRTIEELKKNVYYFQPLPPPPETPKEESEKDSIDDVNVVEFEYRTDDYDPLALVSKQQQRVQPPKSASRYDVQARINSTLTKLNQGANSQEKFVMNLPKVLQQNQRDYQNYSYDDNNNQNQDGNN